MSVEVNPIRSESDYQAALAEVERLWGAEEGTPEADRLDVLFELVWAYEEAHYPASSFEPDDPIAAIEAAMEDRGLTRKDLEPMIGSRAEVAEVLGRKRDLSVAMIRRLHEQLGISADVLIRATRETDLRAAE